MWRGACSSSSPVRRLGKGGCGTPAPHCCHPTPPAAPSPFPQGSQSRCPAHTSPTHPSLRALLLSQLSFLPASLPSVPARDNALGNSLYGDFSFIISASLFYSSTSHSLPDLFTGMAATINIYKRQFFHTRIIKKCLHLFHPGALHLLHKWNRT